MKKLFISADMEGIAGVVTKQQLLVNGFEYQQARQWMTDEVIAVTNAAFESGIDEIVVADSHSNGQNIIIDQLPENVSLVRAWPRPLCMMQGIEEQGIDGHEYVGAVLLGYHGGVHTPRAAMAHTICLQLVELKVNGQLWAEAELSAATAGYYQVPIIMATGDDAFIRQIKPVLGDIETVVTRKSYSAQSGLIITPKKSHKLLTQATKKAISRANEFGLFRVDKRLEVEVTFNSPALIDTLVLLKGVKRINGLTISVDCDDVIELVHFFSFLGSLFSRGWEY